MTITIPDATVAVVTSTQFLVCGYIVIGLIVSIIVCRGLYSVRSRDEPPLLFSVLFLASVWPLIVLGVAIYFLNSAVEAIVLYKAR